MSSSSAGDHLQAAIIGEMVRGQQGAARLRSWLRECRLGADTAVVDGLMEVISDSFSRALSALNSRCGVEAAAGGGSLSSDDRRSETESGGKRKAKSNPDRHGGCRRRSHSSSWRSVTSKTLDDGQSWRKYGQKGIQNSKHPRSYFRCTHKHDQGCEATRQVQQSEADPSTYLITYFGQHTCRDPSTIPQIMEAADDPAPRNSILISFGSNTTTRDTTRPAELASSFPYSLVQQPPSEEEVLSNPTPGSSPVDGFLLATAVGPITSLPPPLSPPPPPPPPRFYSTSPSSWLDVEFLASSFDQFGGYDMFALEYDGDFSASFGLGACI